MLDAIADFFHRTLAEPQRRAQPKLTLELAAAALLCEVMRADYDVSTEERQAVCAMLTKRYSLSQGEVKELIALAEEEVDQAVGYYPFVSLINAHYDYPQRCELVTLMWHLAWADGSLDPLEEHRIRRLASLLHVSHSDFIHAKLKAEGEGATLKAE